MPTYYTPLQMGWGHIIITAGPILPPARPMLRVDQSSRKRRIARIPGTQTFCLGHKVFTRGEFRVRMFFLVGTCQNSSGWEINTHWEIKSPLISIATHFWAAGDVCLCWPIVWLGLQCSNLDRWLTGLPMRDSVIIKVITQGLSDNCFKQMRFRFTIN